MFSHENVGILLDLKIPVAYLYTAFDSMYSVTFCGSKAVDYYKCLPGKICIALKYVDLDSVLVGYDQIFRRILKHDGAASNGTASSEVVFLVDTEGSEGSINEEEFCRRVTEHLNNILNESDATVSFHTYHQHRLYMNGHRSGEAAPHHTHSLLRAPATRKSQNFFAKSFKSLFLPTAHLGDLATAAE